MTKDEFYEMAKHLHLRLSLCEGSENELCMLAAALRVAHEIGFDEGRTEGRVDVGKYARAIGRIEAALGYAGARPLAQTAQAVEDALRVLRRLNSESSGGGHE